MSSLYSRVLLALEIAYISTVRTAFRNVDYEIVADVFDDYTTKAVTKEYDRAICAVLFCSLLIFKTYLSIGMDQRRTPTHDFTFLLIFNLANKSSAAPVTPAELVFKPTFELYPKSSTLTFLILDGKRSLSHSISSPGIPATQVLTPNADSSFHGDSFKGILRPCTATMLVVNKILSEHTATRKHPLLLHILHVWVFSRSEHLKIRYVGVFEKLLRRLQSRNRWSRHSHRLEG